MLLTLSKPCGIFVNMDLQEISTILLTNWNQVTFISSTYLILEDLGKFSPIYEKLFNVKTGSMNFATSEASKVLIT
jgi:hypothetical protein